MILLNSDTMLSSFLKMVLWREKNGYSSWVSCPAKGKVEINPTHCSHTPAKRGNIPGTEINIYLRIFLT